MALTLQREEFRLAISQALGERPGDGGMAVVLVKLRAFHAINTRFGYDAGDATLGGVFDALAELLREPIRPYRVAGTCFGFIVPTVKYPALLRIGIERALEAVREPRTIADDCISLEAIAGAALYPDDGDSPDELWLAAESALQAAAGDETGIVLHAASDHHRRHERWQLVSQLKRAREEDQFRLHYQPQINLQDFATSGFEALLRWQHPQQGFVPPDVFIPLAESSGLINEITDWVVHTALRQTSGLSLMGGRARVSINVSPITLFDPGFPYAIESAVSLWGGSHSQLALEVTEGTLVEDIAVSKRVLGALRDKGVRVAIDDFGTGYSSLAYFRQLPVDELKIDKSFITNLADSEVDRKLVETIVEMGHKLGMQIVAEGVEDERSLNVLRDIGCDVAQGFLISPALPSEDLTAWFGETASRKIH